MFDHSHYVPILRWKQGERFALRDLYDQDRGRMTPLIELVPSDFTHERIRKCGSLNDKFKKTAEQLDSCWHKSPFFIDFCHLQAEINQIASPTPPLLLLANHARSLGLQMIPVTGMLRSAEYQTAIANVITIDKRGVCVRLTVDDVEGNRFEQELRELLLRFHLQPAHVHLLIDSELIDNTDLSIARLSILLPELSKWRTFTVASGAFPPDLSNLEVGTHEVRRSDWLAWKREVVSSRLARAPTYGDYATRHPVFMEPPPKARVSASIRYTADEHWVVMRGEWVNRPGGPGFKQYPANAMLLRERSEFCGDAFSAGDHYIAQMNLHSPHTGNATTWVEASVNHHLTFTVRQIAKLFSASTAAVPYSEGGRGRPLRPGAGRWMR
jgi:hypothetical protein